MLKETFIDLLNYNYILLKPDSISLQFVSISFFIYDNILFVIFSVPLKLLNLEIPTQDLDNLSNIYKSD
jgi:hypothetical protein